LASCAFRLHWSLSWAFLLHPSIPISRKSSWTLYNIENTKVHAPGGVRTPNPHKRSGRRPSP
jgi:hypothetical protein